MILSIRRQVKHKVYDYYTKCAHFCQTTYSFNVELLFSLSVVPNGTLARDAQCCPIFTQTITCCTLINYEREMPCRQPLPSKGLFIRQRRTPRGPPIDISITCIAHLSDYCCISRFFLIVIFDVILQGCFGRMAGNKSVGMSAVS